MSRNRIAHRAEFPVRCACGMVYNSQEAHIGRQIKCKCGRTVLIARPVDEYAGAYDAKAREQQAHREREKATKARRARSARRMAGLREVPRRAGRALRTLVLDAWTVMGSHRPVRRWTARMAWVWSAFVVITWVLLITTSESFLPATLLAYGPRIVMLLPFALLVPFAAVVARSALVPLSVSLLVVVGPIMGGRVSWRTIAQGMPAAPGPGMVRVMTFNAEGGGLVSMQLRHTLERLRPDLMAFQECGDGLWDTLQALPLWHSARHGNLCTASRWPITLADSMPRGDFQRIAQYGFGGTALVARHTIASPHGPLLFVNLHLETARKGLEGLSGGDGFVPDRLTVPSANAGPSRGEIANRIEINAQIRDRESERAAIWSSRGDKSIPLLIAGDFNLPVESAIFRRHWGDFTDAFEAAGTGLGWTKSEGSLLRIRIDHILGNSAAPRPRGTWLGPELGSDHRPLITDLAWR